MNTLLRLSLVSGLALAIGACGGDDDNPAVDGGVLDDGGNLIDAAPPVSVSGTAYGIDDVPLAGATVKIYGASPEVTATTDGSGNFTIDAPIGDIWFNASATDYWDLLVNINIQVAGNGALELYLVGDSEVAEVDAALANETVNEAKGILPIEFENQIEDARAEITADSEFNFVFDANDEPVAGEDKLLLNGGQEVIYVGVTVGTTTVTIRDAPGCTLDYDGDYPVVARTFTEAHASCQ